MQTFSQSDSTKIFGWVLADARLERKFVTDAKVLLYEGTSVHEAISDSKGYYSFNLNKLLDTAIINVQLNKSSTTGSPNDKLFVPTNTKTKLVFGQNNSLKHNIILKISTNCRSIPEINFAFNSLKLIYDTLNNNSADPNYEDRSPDAAIGAIISVLTDNPNIVAELSGHCDSREKSILSNKRAEFIKSELVKNGINPKRLICKGYGSTKPIYETSTINKAVDKTEKNLYHQRNRRVTMRVVSTDFKDN